jgi:hypothetical protein
VEHLEGAPRYTQAFLTDTRLVWKSMPQANTLAYYKHLKIMEDKSLITLGHGDILYSSGTIFTTLLFVVTYELDL